MAEMLLIDYRSCGKRVVLFDGNCKNCVLRLIKTTDGEYLYPGERNCDKFEPKDGDG